VTRRLMLVWSVGDNEESTCDDGYAVAIKQLEYAWHWFSCGVGHQEASSKI
jgi:hypothetical protein